MPWQVIHSCAFEHDLFSRNESISNDTCDYLIFSSSSRKTRRSLHICIDQYIQTKKGGNYGQPKIPQVPPITNTPGQLKRRFVLWKVKRLITLVISLFSQLKCVFEQRRASHVQYLNANARDLLLSLIFRFDTCYVRAFTRRQIDGFSRKTRRTLHTCIYTGQILFWFSEKTKCLNFYVNLIELKCLSHLALNSGRRPEKNVF